MLYVYLCLLELGLGFQKNVLSVLLKNRLNYILYCKNSLVKKRSRQSSEILIIRQTEV